VTRLLTSKDFSYWRFYSVMKEGYEGVYSDTYYEAPAYKRAFDFGRTRRDKPFREVQQEWDTFFL
jgi:hypothetical protein